MTSKNDFAGRDNGLFLSIVESFLLCSALGANMCTITMDGSSRDFTETHIYDEWRQYVVRAQEKIIHVCVQTISPVRSVPMRTLLRPSLLWIGLGIKMVGVHLCTNCRTNIIILSPSSLAHKVSPLQKIDPSIQRSHLWSIQMGD